MLPPAHSNRKEPETKHFSPSLTRECARNTRPIFVLGRLETSCLMVAILASVWMGGCAQSSGGGIQPPPPPQIAVTVSPTAGMVLLGNSTTFMATVTNTGNTAVTWSVNGVAGGSTAAGTITELGVYTAPADLPSPASVQLTATSVADPTKVASAAVTISSDIVVQIAPNVAGVELGALQAFVGTVHSAGHPDIALRWSIAGAACPNNCGSVGTKGNYSAPQILPTGAAVTVTAQSVADPSKQASAAITITSHLSLTIVAPAMVPANGSAAIVATLTPVPGSSPSEVLNWTISGAGCSASSCGTFSSIPQASSSGNVTTNTATYKAPTAAPTPDSVTVTVTPQADPTKAASATISITPTIGLAITPATATLAANHRVTLMPQVNGTANTTVLWNVNGVSGGNVVLGQICATGSNPCQAVTGGDSGPVDYLAPGTIPTPDPVTVQAVSAEDAGDSAAAQITVINHVVVSVFPGSATLAPMTVQAFAASVLGTSNQSVVWQIAGAGCNVAGAGPCGAINTSGIYTAPPTAPAPDALQVVAVSQDDTTQSGAANVTISTGANILTLLPASVYAGAAQGFTLQVDGSAFAEGTSGAGSSIRIAGSGRTTSCISTSRCSAPVTASDVATAGNVAVQVINPDGTQSNSLNLVVAQPNSSDAMVTLTNATPSATAQNVEVVDATTAGISTPDDDVDLNLAALGMFNAAANSCTLAGNPVTVTRPASGSATADLCLFSEAGLDTSMTFTVSGPADITVIAKQPAGLGILHITLLIPAGAFPGPRTIFAVSTNLDEAAASGALEVQ